MPTLRELLIESVVMIAVGVALAALGPFGSFALGSFAARLAYWVPAALLGYAIFRPATLLAIVIARRLALAELPSVMIGVLVAAVPATFAIAVFGGFQPLPEPGFEDLFQLYVQVGLIGALVTMLFTLIERRPTPPIVEPPREPAPADALPAVAEPIPTPAFLERLPPAWRDRLVALEMEDHYVRAHGPGTSSLILLRMRDAERELAGVDGLRVHRSWWVAREAVEQVLRDGRNIRLRLIGGLEAPVARDRIAALRAAGLLD